MIGYKAKTVWSQVLAMALGSMLTCAAGWVPTAWAQGGTAQLIRIFETDDLFSQEFFVGVAPELAGLAFPPGAYTLLEQPAGGAATVALIAPPKNKSANVSRTRLTLSDPINSAFDSVAQGSKGAGLFRLFLFEETTGELMAIKATAKDVLDPVTLKRFNARPLAVADAEGMTFDPKTGSLFILDNAAAQIVRVRAAPGRDFDGVSAAKQGRISLISLPGGLGDLRGIAFNPASGDLVLFSPSAGMLYELTVTGELVAAVTLPGFKGFQPEALQGLVFGPSADRTDDPSVFHLYIAATSGQVTGLSEWTF